jgi:hypothetical protein
MMTIFSLATLLTLMVINFFGRVNCDPGLVNFRDRYYASILCQHKLCQHRMPTYANKVSVGDSIVTTIIHNVSRVTSAGSSEELAESNVSQTTRLETEDSEPPLGLRGSYRSTKSPPTVYPT